MKEIDKIATLPSFRGYLSDLGGPSANMYGMKGVDMARCMKCSRPSCIWPQVCNNLDTSHAKLTDLYKKVNRRGDIKKAFIGSGVRYDLLFTEWNKNAGKAEREYLEELITGHVSGRLKVAPEHTAPHVLALMRKAPFALFRKLKKKFDEITEKNQLRYELIPYFISSMPGCTEQDMRELAKEASAMGLKPEQVQDFTPTPMTLSTLIYYTGKDPYTGKKVYVATKSEEKKRQKEFFFLRNEGERRQAPGVRFRKAPHSGKPASQQRGDGRPVTKAPLPGEHAPQKRGAGGGFIKHDNKKKHPPKQKRTGTR